jgi:hypothetical protein
VIARLHKLLARPIGEDQRTSAFALAAGAVLLGLLALSLTRPHAHPATPRQPTAAAAAAPASPYPDSAPSRAPAVSAWELAAQRAARGFLSGYLRYLYGHARAGAIRDATAALARRLASERLRVSPAQRRRHPRLVALRVGLQGPAVVVVGARIADGGVARYPIELTLHRQRRRWLVSAIGDE